MVGAPGRAHRDPGGRRKTLLTYWNTAAFQALYAGTAGWSPSVADPAPSARPLLDRWVLAELTALIGEVDAAMDAFDPQRAGKALTAFIDDLSNWYVRRGRRRFWRGDPAALATLHDVLETLTRLMAPLTPFITERVWQDMVVPVTPAAEESVHLATYPVADGALADAVLAERMALVRRLVELGRAARADSGVRTRQPLSRALVAAAGIADLPVELLELVAEELNVSSVAPLSSASPTGSLVDTTAKANFRTLGRRFGKGVQAVASAVASADAAALGAALRSTGTATVLVGGEPVVLGPDEVVITETPRHGWAVASDAGATVALDLEITPVLRRAGVARDVIRQIQEARKTSGLEVSDRIVVRYAATSAETGAALAEHGGLVADEVLAIGFEPGSGDGPGFADDALGLRFWIRRAQ